MHNQISRPKEHFIFIEIIFPRFYWLIKYTTKFLNSSLQLYAYLHKNRSKTYWLIIRTPTAQVHNSSKRFLRSFQFFRSRSTRNHCSRRLRRKLLLRLRQWSEVTLGILMDGSDGIIPSTESLIFQCFNCSNACRYHPRSARRTHFSGVISSLSLEFKLFFSATNFRKKTFSRLIDWCLFVWIDSVGVYIYIYISRVRRLE